MGEAYDIVKVMVETKKEQKEDCDRISQGPRRREKTIKGLVKRQSGGGAVRCWEGDKEWNSCVLKKEVTETVRIGNCLLVFQSTLLFRWYCRARFCFLLPLCFCFWNPKSRYHIIAHIPSATKRIKRRWRGNLFEYVVDVNIRELSSSQLLLISANFS